MPVNLKGRSFLSLMDFSAAEIRYLLDLSHDLKCKKRSGILGKSLRGKNVVLLFEKTSTRTRCAFETAIHDEGGQVTYLDAGSSQMGKKESLEDTAKVLGRFFDGIESVACKAYRKFFQSYNISDYSFRCSLLEQKKYGYCEDYQQWNRCYRMK